ncbi:PDZ domain-containing protein [Paenibacillus sp. HJGM_3]|uniref:PDZ domain-containing protein n=1 Tax=Paenibacillus sp. HJGM_3 TaxID=3379816 RepID=UPI00385E6F1C
MIKSLAVRYNGAIKETFVDSDGKEAAAMERGQKWYVVGMAWAVIIILLGELIWLPDPLRFGAGKSLFWIDAIDAVAYAILLVPLAWLAGAVRSLAAGLRRHGGRGRAPAVADGSAGTAAGAAVAGPAGAASGTGGAASTSGAAGAGSPAAGGARPPARGRSRLAAVAAALPPAAVAVASAASIGALLMEPRRLVAAAALLGAAALFAALDLALAERRRRGRAIPWRSLAGTAVSALMLLALLLPTGYMVTYPGITINMSRYATAQGGTAHSPMIGVLVFERPAFPADWLFAKLFPHYAFEPRENLGMSLGAYDTLVRDMKAEADALGSAIAFQRAGLGRGAVPHGVKVSAVLQGGTAEGKLRPGDVIQQANGRALTTSAELTAFMRGVRPGDEVTLTLKRGSETVSQRVGTRPHPDNPNQAAFGIQIEDELEYDLPRQVEFHDYLAHEGGPSHGAMLTLALLDQLTPGGITNGNLVAGTGTINPDGSIGRIGGIEQKAYTVERSGADVFFVPDGQEEEARRGSNRLQIVPVRTVQDVLDWLKAHPKR